MMSLNHNSVCPEKNRLATEQGLTLLELMIVCGMVVVAIGAMHSLYLTNQRTTAAQDEVAEVQQNLRIAMDAVSRDIKTSGLLITANSSPVASVNTISALTGTDNLILRTASIEGIYARICADQTGASSPFVVDSADTAASFNSGGSGVGDQVRIIRPVGKAEPTEGTLFRVSSKNTETPSLTLTFESGNSASSTEFMRGDIIAKTGSTYPNTIAYCVGPASGGCGATVTTCPAGQSCLIRVENDVPTVIASNIDDFELSYFLEDDTEVDVPSDTSTIRAIRISIMGRSANDVSGSVAKEREITSIVRLRNKYDW